MEASGNRFFDAAACVFRGVLERTDGSVLRGRRWLGVVVMTCVVMAGVGMGGCENDVSDKDIATVDVAAVRKIVEGRKAGDGSMVVVDARQPELFAAGRLPGAMNLTIADLREGGRPPMEVEQAKTVVVYGQDPGSGLARGLAKRIYMAGQKGVKLFEGGFKVWQASGLPIEKDSEKE